jgi:hypothetical protein
MSEHDQNQSLRGIYLALHRGASYSVLTDADLESHLNRLENPSRITPKILFTVALAERHQPTGKTRHYRAGELLPPRSGLVIAQFAGDPGFYLCYLNADGKELTDTYHATIEDAKHQADFEFNVTDSDWGNKENLA